MATGRTRSRARRVLPYRTTPRRFAARHAPLPPRSWDTYAEEAWDFLVDGKLSSPGGGGAR